MKFYNQSAILFGLLLPALLAGGVVAACVLGTQHYQTRLAEKSEVFKDLQRSRIGMKQIEAAVAAEQENLNRWQERLAEETAAALPRHLRKIGEMLPENEFQETSLDVSGGSRGLGTISAQKSSQVRLGARGTYRSLQRAFLELETRMPQLQLEELRLTPSPNQPSLLNAQVSFTAWEK